MNHCGECTFKSKRASAMTRHRNQVHRIDRYQHHPWQSPGGRATSSEPAKITNAAHGKMQQGMTTNDGPHHVSQTMTRSSGHHSMPQVTIGNAGHNIMPQLTAQNAGHAGHFSIPQVTMGNAVHQSMPPVITRNIGPHGKSQAIDNEHPQLAHGITLHYITLHLLRI